MKMWIHPGHIGGGNAVRSSVRSNSSRPSERSPFGRVINNDVPEDTSKENLSAFFTSGICSALFAALFTCGVSYLLPPASSLSSRSHAAMQSLYSGFDAKENRSPARQKFLAGLLSEEAFQRKSQVHFISSLIQSQLRDHPNPESLAHLIVSESVLADYDPFLVAAVIRSESMFRRSAVSCVGAKGLMQIMPDTARFLAKKANIPIGNSSLHDPHINVRLGIAYLKYLEKMFKGNRQRALIAYNWGPANLGSAIKRRTSPPQSTLHYAQKILHHQSKWKQQYMQLASNLEVSVG